MKRYNYKLPDISKMLIWDTFTFGNKEYIVCTNKYWIRIFKEFDFKYSNLP